MNPPLQEPVYVFMKALWAFLLVWAALSAATLELLPEPAEQARPFVYGVP